MTSTGPRRERGRSFAETTTTATVVRAFWAWIPALLEGILGRLQHEAERVAHLPRLAEAGPRDEALRAMLWSAPLAVLALVSVYMLSQDPRLDAAFKLIGQLSALFLVPLLVHATQLVTNVR